MMGNRTRTIPHRYLSLGVILMLLVSLSGGFAGAQAAEKSESTLAGTTIENDYAACTADDDNLIIRCNLKAVANQSSLDLVTNILPLAQQVNSAITADTTMWLQAWGGQGGRGESTINGSGGNGGNGGFAQTITTISDYQSKYGTTTIHYYLGGCCKNDVDGSEYGGGGASTIVATDASDFTLDNLLLIAGGGGGGNNAIQGADGQNGGHGGYANATTTKWTYGAGQNLSTREGTAYGGSFDGPGSGGTSPDGQGDGQSGYGGRGGGYYNDLDYYTLWQNGDPNVSANGAGGEANWNYAAGGGGLGGGGTASPCGNNAQHHNCAAAGGGSFAAGLTIHDWYAPQTYQPGAGQSLIHIVFNLQPIGFPAYDPPINYPFGLANPNNSTYVAPAFGDLRNTGIPDLLLGDSSGALWYYQSSSGPTYSEAQKDPLGLENSIGYKAASPTFVDINNDGVLDLFVGDKSGRIWYYHNTGTATSPAFASAVANPFHIAFGTFSFQGVTGPPTNAAPTFADIDSDGDQDLFVGLTLDSGGQSGPVTFFENTGTAEDPAFAAPQINPFGIYQFPNGTYAAAPAFVDNDGDGDLDLFIGAGGGSTWYQINEGSATNPSFGRTVANPDGVRKLASAHARPTTADVNGDGLLDLWVGASGGALYYYANTGPATAGSVADEPVLSFDAAPAIAISLDDLAEQQVTTVVYGSETFDASQVNRDMISLEDWSGNELAQVTQNFWGTALGDLNGDGYLDRTLVFANADVEAIMTEVDDGKELCVAGVTSDGVEFHSCAFVEPLGGNEN